MAARHERVVVDIGTGSGSAVLRRAAREPRNLFIALDAEAGAMADASRRAARPTRKGGRPNILFAVAAAESLPDAMRGLADEVMVILPWGSLLAAVLAPATATFRGIARCLAPDGELTILISTEPRDQLVTTAELHEGAAAVLAKAYCAAGFVDVEFRPANREDVERLSSGWGRRLGIPERRRAWLYRLRVTSI